MTIPNPKPRGRVRASQSDWSDLHEVFADKPCVACGKAANHLHHVCFKGADSGDDVPENLVPICLVCHQLFHDRAPGWEQIAGRIRAYVWDRQSRLNYVLDRIGLEKFDKRYPLPVWLRMGDLTPRVRSELPE